MHCKCGPNFYEFGKRIGVHVRAFLSVEISGVLSTRKAVGGAIIFSQILMHNLDGVIINKMCDKCTNPIFFSFFLPLLPASCLILSSRVGRWSCGNIEILNNSNLRCVIFYSCSCLNVPFICTDMFPPLSIVKKK